MPAAASISLREKVVGWSGIGSAHCDAPPVRRGGQSPTSAVSNAARSASAVARDGSASAGQRYCAEKASTLPRNTSTPAVSSAWTVPRAHRIMTGVVCRSHARRDAHYESSSASATESAVRTTAPRDAGPCGAARVRPHPGRAQHPQAVDSGAASDSLGPAAPHGLRLDGVQGKARGEHAPESLSLCAARFAAVELDQHERARARPQPPAEGGEVFLVNRSKTRGRIPDLYPPAVGPVGLPPPVDLSASRRYRPAA